MAYHLMINVMEAPFGRPPALVLRSAVIAALSGTRPLARLHEAGRRLAAKRLPEGALERFMEEQIAIDTNPFVRCAATAMTSSQAFQLHGKYESRADVSIKTISELAPDGRARILRRIVPRSVADMTICRDAHLAAIDSVCRSVARLRSSRARAVGVKLSVVAASVGLERTLAADAALALEEDPTLKVGDLARRLGWHVRTLERRLRREGLTAMAMKRSAMIIHATSLLPHPSSLTTIAHESGYADLAHMSRAFMSSCSMTPTELRAAVRPASAETLRERSAGDGRNGGFADPAD